MGPYAILITSGSAVVVEMAEPPRRSLSFGIEAGRLLPTQEGFDRVSPAPRALASVTEDQVIYAEQHRRLESVWQPRHK